MSDILPSMYTLATALKARMEEAYPGLGREDGGDLAGKGSWVVTARSQRFETQQPMGHGQVGTANVDVAFQSDDEDVVWAIENLLSGFKLEPFDSVLIAGTERTRIQDGGDDSAVAVIINVEGNYHREFG